MKYIYYYGTEEDKENITIDTFPTYDPTDSSFHGDWALYYATWFYFTENGENETAVGNWWYFDTDGKTIIQKIVE